MVSVNVESLAFVAIAIYSIVKSLKWILMKRKLNRWKDTPRGVVVLHGFHRMPKIPTGSPFVLKVETFLRMANIPYKYDSTDSFGPNGKTPWISLNGEHVADSQIIINFLKKKFDINLDGKYSDEKIAIGHSARIMLEEHLFWCLTRKLFMESPDKEITHFHVPFARSLILFNVRRVYKSYLWAQGLGRLSAEDSELLMMKNFEACSKILGNNKFFLGDEPSEVDAATFSFAAQLLWGPLSDTAQIASIRGMYPNLGDYVGRMKEMFWPDWENNLAKKKEKPGQ